MKEIKLYSDDLEQSIRELACSDKLENEGILIPESDYGFAEIYRIHDDYLVFLIPTYGGVPSFYKCYSTHSISTLVKDLRTIT